MPHRSRMLFKALALAGVVLAGCGEGEAAQPAPCEALTERGGVVVGSGLPGDPAAAVRASDYRTGMAVVSARTYMVVTGNPLASKAGCEVLQAGGSAIDAAIAAQLVLGLVEPHASGLGGGAFLLYHDASDRTVQAYDGRETAPAAATENYLRYIDDASDQTPPVPSARASGRSIGTPGVVRMLELAHRDHGRLAWSDLFAPAVALARDGFAIGGRLAVAIEVSRAELAASPEAAATFLESDGAAKPLGATLRNPAYATTLAALAAGGGDAFYTGDIAQAIVDEIGVASSATGAPITPGRTTLDDLGRYEALRRDAVCVAYRAHRVCGMPPPSSGGIAVASALGVLEAFDLGAYRPRAVNREGGELQVAGVHLVAEAERLAYADRDRYIADADFVPLPGGSPAALLDKAYLSARAGLIRMDASLGTAEPGTFAGAALASDRTPDHGTSQITVVDADGNAVAMTTTVESFFGSFHMTRGVVLNNQLTDFSVVPADVAGTPIANRVAPGKRPRSSMAPTLVFEAGADGARGELVMATGSPGGSAIIQYVVKTVVGVLDWGLDPQQAAALIDFGAANDPTTNVGGEHPGVGSASSDRLITGLRALGHTVNPGPQSSGIATVMVVRSADGVRLTGGADPRREGLVLGDLFRP
jgi:gamma-glutamyltranspeptidase / glutathione hydrolase